MPVKHYLIGKTFGRLKVIEDAEPYIKPSGKPQRRSLCLCDCGNTPVIVNASLLSGYTRSCGCLHKELLIKRCTKHGHSPAGHSSITYQSWAGMVQRCTNPNVVCWENYGGRGITVCERWVNFENFLADMGECPPGLTIDRYPDKNGNYEPSNCRWATAAEQNRNTRQNRMFTVNGVTGCLTDLAKLHGINMFTAITRIDDLGWTPENAFTKPVRKHRKHSHV